MSTGILVLEDGREFAGRLFGADVSAESILAANKSASRDRGYGEVVFNTSMTGYQEILTDPSYCGQIVCMTVPHVGNTGVNDTDPESAHPWCAGFIVHDECSKPSSWRSEGGLDAYLKKNGIPGLADVDTRALTRHLRTKGVIRGLILPAEQKSHAAELLKRIPGFEGRDLINEVSTPQPYHWQQKGQPSAQSKRFRVVAYDFGLKWNLLRSLERLGCEVEVVPAKTSAETVLAKKPDGIFLSNGPGDPSAAPYAADAVRKLIGKVPLFGVCMGHQILALALGAKTYKLKFGHRGGNQPVLDQTTKKVEISSHNHGYSVSGENLPKWVEITHINLNDKTVEGLQYLGKGAPAFSVQYHPEACPGPHDSVLLFDRFVAAMEKAKR